MLDGWQTFNYFSLSISQHDGKYSVKKYEDNGDLTFYNRYVDDIICCIKKESTEVLLTDMNNFNFNLHFTLKKMQNGLLNLLDTTIFFQNNIPELKHHIKDGAD